MKVRHTVKARRTRTAPTVARRNRKSEIESSSMQRREFLAFALAASRAYASASGKIALSLLPLYAPKQKPVSRDVIEAVIAALNKVYLVTVKICEPQLYDGSSDGTAVLESLSPREGCVMAIMSGPLRAPVRNGIHTSIRNVSGWADIPNDDRERPRGSVITTYALAGLREDDAGERIGVIAVHELGHNLGAWDCHEGLCYMNEKIDLGRVMMPRAFCKRHREMLWTFLRRADYGASPSAESFSNSSLGITES